MTINAEDERPIFENILFYGKNPKLLEHNGKEYRERNTRRMFRAWMAAKRHEASKRANACNP